MLYNLEELEMIDKIFNQKLLGNLDGLLEGTFTSVTDADRSKDRIYQNGNCRFDLSTYRSFLSSNGKRFVGIEMDFKVEGDASNGQSYDQYWKDIHSAFSEINDKISELGAKVDKYIIWELDHNIRKGEITGVRLWYPENSKPKDVARAIATTQRILFERMSQYIGPKAVDSQPNLYLFL